MRRSLSVLIYGRGFAGFDNEQLEFFSQFKDIKQQAALLKYQKPSTNTKEWGIYNEAVDDLYTKMLSGQRNMTSFAFRKAIIVEALKAFGTPSFHEWCSLQLRNKYVGQLHFEFLNDTFKFILEGERFKGLRAWEFVLKPAQYNLDAKKLELEHEKILNKLLDKGLTGTKGVIQQWLSQPRGFEDLLWTLHLIFGKVEKTKES